MQREMVKMFVAFTVGIVLCGAMLTGVYVWVLRPEQKQPDVPPLAAISEREAVQILRDRELPEGDARHAAERTAFFGRNLQFLALKKKHREVCAWSFSEADVPVMEEWLKRNGKLVWATLLQEVDDPFNFRLNLDQYDLKEAACTRTYSTAPINAMSRIILEDSLTVTMTLAVKDTVRKAEIQWPADFRWGYIASVKLQFVLARDTVRSVMIDVDDRRQKDEFYRPINRERLQEDMTRALQAIFRSDGRPGWVYLSDEEAKEPVWKGIP